MGTCEKDWAFSLKNFLPSSTNKAFFYFWHFCLLVAVGSLSATTLLANAGEIALKSALKQSQRATVVRALSCLSSRRWSETMQTVAAWKSKWPGWCSDWTTSTAKRLPKSLMSTVTTWRPTGLRSTGDDQSNRYLLGDAHRKATSVLVFFVASLRFSVLSSVFELQRSWPGWRYLQLEPVPCRCHCCFFCWSLWSC